MARTESEQLVVQLEARITQFERNFQRANRTANQSWRQIENRGRQAGRRIEADMARTSAGVASSMGRMRASIVGAMGAFGIGGAALVRSIRSVVSEMSELSKQARTIGVSFEEIQRLQYGFQLVGVEASSLTRHMESFVQRLGEADARGGRLADILQANGVALRNQNGEMRGTLDLLRDFADLVKNAENEAAALNIAAQAFGERGAREMVRGLRDGSIGLDQMAAAADEAGGVLENSLGKRAEEIDDKFAKLSRTISVTFKQAVLDTVGAVDEMAQVLDRLGRSIANAIGAGEFRARNLLRDKLQRGEFDRPGDLSWVDELRGPPPEAAPGRTTIVPGGGRSSGGGGGGGRASGRDAAARAARDEAQAVAELIERLEEELRLVDATAVERRIANELRRSGSAATDEQRQKIGELIRAIEEERASVVELEKAMNELAGTAKDFLSGFISDLRRGVDATQALHNALDRLADRLLNMALDQLFGHIGGGIFGGLGGGVTPGLFASGGIVRGPGTGTSDSIPAMVSNGEFIVRASATRQHRQLLEAINAGRLPKFASGGAVKAPASFGPSGINTSLKIEITDRAGIEIEQGTPKVRGSETVIPLLIRRLRHEMAGDIASNGPLGRTMQQTFGLNRRTS